MLNLCVNARDAIAGGGSITITAENLQEAGEDGLLTHFVKLSIVDTGCGMPPEVLARVFEPFFTTKDVGKGSGLGLPQVYGFAQQSGGRLTINSEVGVGTTVALLLPRSLRQPAGPKTVDASRASSVRSDGTRRGQLLLVEDDDEVAALTREMLNSLGFSVIHVASPAAALGALANARPVDIVLSDIMMPGGVSGLELAREIKRRQPNLPIVLTTGYAEAAAGMTDGEFQLLLKPYSVEELADALGVDMN
jgi:CheY-like chemotaxis protein